MPVQGSPRVLVVDNFDSFTFTLVDYLRRLRAAVRVERNDAIRTDEALAFDAIVISPGPGTPEDAGVSVSLAAACIAGDKPLLGVCLGHQAIARACGSAVERVTPVHGKAGPVRHDGSGVFAGLPSPFEAARYHSLAVPDPRPPLVANAWSEDGLVMGLRHVEAPVHGVQFHPESIASEHGLALLGRFLDLTVPQAA
jgi:anthranilate synthase component 2